MKNALETLFSDMRRFYRDDKIAWEETCKVIEDELKHKKYLEDLLIMNGIDIKKNIQNMTYIADYQ